jgi:hypothetical protein
MNATMIEQAVAEPVHGETRRVIVLEGQRVGQDAVVDFGDFDRPGQVYRTVVFGRIAPDGLALGDSCLIRYEQATRKGKPARWNFLERLTETGEDHSWT